MPQVGQAACCNFCCWHWLHVDVEAGVAFQELRRWRVRERDIFRFGNGTAHSFEKSDQDLGQPTRAEVSPRSRAFAKSWLYLRRYLGLSLPASQTRPAWICRLMGMVVGKVLPFLATDAAESATVGAAERIDRQGKDYGVARCDFEVCNI